MPTANGAFKINRRISTPCDWDGGSVQQNRWEKTYTGEITGTGVLESIMLGLDSDGFLDTSGGPVMYVGIERIACTLAGRKGAFIGVLQGNSWDGKVSKSWTILEGSGTGELEGITGTGKILANHDFVLEYEFTPARVAPVTPVSPAVLAAAAV